MNNPTGGHRRARRPSPAGGRIGDRSQSVLVHRFQGSGLLPRDGEMAVLSEEFVEGLAEQGLDGPAL